MEKITFKELCDYLENNHDKQGVVVIKNHPKWKREFPLESRSYIVCGNDKYFNPEMIGRSLYGYSIDKTDMGVRLDWYIHDENKEDRWEIDYCYLMEEEA